MTPKQIGRILRKARGERSKREVAAAAGLYRTQVDAMEEGATEHYTIGSLLKLCKELGLKVTFHPPSDEG
jgi:DNA-binding Xre family transcriptional regulator